MDNKNAEPSGETAGRGGPSVDAAFAALANERRRLVVAYFRDGDREEAHVDDLAAYVANRGVGGDRESVEIALHHVDLEKLVGAGIVDHDSTLGRVTYRGHPILEACPSLVDSEEAPCSS